MIPKTIHYCWFGKGEKPELIKGCMKSWDKLKRAGYEIVEWNEDNCDLNENPFVSEMYALKKFAFVSDYFRLKALYEYGGIYLDTDVYAYKKFDDLLNCDLFLGYIYDCALGTAVIGAAKKNSIISELLQNYSKEMDGSNCVNNGLMTEYFYKQVSGFQLNGLRQVLILPNGEKIDLYPKDVFECGKIVGRSYSLHFSEGSWHQAKQKTSPKIKMMAARLPINLMAYRQHQKAKTFMQQDGKYQKWYFEENKA